MLEPVQHEQHALALEPLLELVEHQQIEIVAQIERFGQKRKHLLGIVHGGKRNEHDAIGKGITRVEIELGGQTRFSDSAGSGDGDQPDRRIGKHLLQSGEIALASEERGPEIDGFAPVDLGAPGLHIVR